MDLPENLDDLLAEITKRGFSVSIFSASVFSSAMIGPRVFVSKSVFPPKHTDVNVIIGSGNTVLEATKNAVERIISAEKW